MYKEMFQVIYDDVHLAAKLYLDEPHPEDELAEIAYSFFSDWARSGEYPGQEEIAEEVTKLRGTYEHKNEI